MAPKPKLSGTITEKQYWYILRLMRNISLREQFTKHDELVEVAKAEFGDISSFTTEQATDLINRLRSQSDFVTRKICKISGFPLRAIPPGALIDQKPDPEQDERWEKALAKIRKEQKT